MFNVHVYLVYRGDRFSDSIIKARWLRALTDAPLMALTASAPPHIEAQICSSLHLRELDVVSEPLDRPNITRYGSTLYIGIA